MPIKNKILFDLVNDPRLAAMTGTDAENRDKALEALLAVDISNPVEFRKAVVRHGVFWETLDPNIKPNTRSTWQLIAPEFLGGRTPEAFFSNDDFLSSTVSDNSLAKIKLAAAEQRVKFGVNAIKDQAVLLQILSHNTEECRAYLATKVPAITGTHGWIPSVKPALVGGVQPPDTNSSINILPDIAIKRIKQQAANQFLTQVVTDAKSDKLSQLEALITHKNDPASLKTAMEALGLPVQSTPLFDRLNGDLERAVTTRITALKNEAAIAKFKEELQKFEDGLKKPEDLLRESVLLNDTVDNFRNAVGGRFPPPPPDDYINRAKADGTVQTLVEDMHKRLCVRYVEEELKKVPDVPAPINVAHMAEALKKTTFGDIKTQIRTNFLPGKDEILNRAIVDNPEQNRLFKAALVKRYIKELTGTPNKAFLEKLAKPETDIKEIRRELAAKIGNGLTHEHLDCLQESDLKEIKQPARREVFKLLVGEGHPKLIEAFSSLPDKKQEELIKLKPEELRFRLNAQTKSVLKSYLGNDVNGKDDYLAGIVTENKNNAFFKQINNTEIAKILAGYNPPITDMNDAKVKAINDILLAKRGNDLTDLAQIADYKAIVDVLFTQSGIADDAPAHNNKQAFYAAFNLNPAGTAFGPSVAITNAIKTQHDHNLLLHNKLHTVKALPVPPPHSGYEKLLDVLLKVEKTAQFDPNAGGLDNIRNKFYESPTLEKFLDVPEVQLIKDKLKEQLSDEFDNIRQGLKVDKAGSVNAVDTPQQKKDIQEAEKAFLKIDARRDALQDKLGEIAVITRISTSHDKKAPEFVGQSQEKLREDHDTYTTAKNKCLDYISYLEKAQKDLQALRPAIPAKLNPPSTAKEVSARNDLRREAYQLDLKIQAELTQVKKLLGKYQTAYTVITQEILPAVEEASKDSKRVTYQATDLTIVRRGRKEALDMGHKYTDPDDPHIIAKPKARNTNVLPGQDPESLFKATGKPDPNEVICFDTSKPVTIVVPGPGGTRTNENVVIEGRFTYDPSPKGGISGTMTGSDVTRAMPGKYEVIQSPRPTNDPQGKKKAGEITDEQIDFYMKMATQILSNVKLPLNKKIVVEGVRGKDDEVKFLHTALLLVGEKKGLKPDDFRVTGDADYNPQAQRKKTAGIDRGFSDTSWYKKHFVNPDGTVKNMVKNHLDQFETEVKGKKEQVKTTEKVSSSLQSTMKEEFQVGREIQDEAKKRKEQEGITPEVARVIANNG
ncbi:hypothetical protein [Legionella resiliens]|uniref:Interaptin n=1 Tax=Legionella resiliens TaxID=2905958 RepID=A0ABS8X2G3_9GAMM|nr:MULTISPECIES: hypothetical protein [unclassified Legionella]MCE0722659.1 hypothetical protein [Legionella sp. 9fVS26]MCE3531812.1 hypothetical protein [Legionella sp. 8cVS16]